MFIQPCFDFVLLIVVKLFIDLCAIDFEVFLRSGLRGHGAIAMPSRPGHRRRRPLSCRITCGQLETFLSSPRHKISELEPCNSNDLARFRSSDGCEVGLIFDGVVNDSTKKHLPLVNALNTHTINRLSFDAGNNRQCSSFSTSKLLCKRK